jgi:hypothetical protein
MSVANTITVNTSFDDVLQERLNHPTTWKEMVDVTVSDNGVISSSYMSTTPSVQTVTRGTGVSAQTFAETAETITVSTGRDLGLIVDLADLAQSPWTKQAMLFDRIGSLLNEFIESNVLGQHANWTDVGDNGSGGVASGQTTGLTVSASSIDDIIRGCKRIIRVANGQELWNRNGLGAVWRPQDFEYLEAFVQANGFAQADQALKAGTVEGLHYLGVDHYWSNDLASGHVFFAVKQVQRLGILRGTYGQAHVIDFPAADSGTFFSGKAFYSRVDIGHLAPSGLKAVLLDVNVA